MTLFPTRRRTWLVLAASIFLLAFVAGYFIDTFAYSSVCTRCGAIQTNSEWKIPSLRKTLELHSSESQTPVSTALSRMGAISDHEHQWLFCSGGGGDILCAIGAGRHIAVRSEEVASLLESIHQFGDKQFRDLIISLLFDPKTSGLVRSFSLSIPAGGFANMNEYRVWLEEHTVDFDERVLEYQRR